MYKSIQACRGLAALQVVLFHLGGMLAAPKYFGVPAFARIFIFGGTGVEFFFVLSGFIIVWVHRRDFGRPAALPGYVSKRLIRIYPTYWIIFIGVFLLAWTSRALRTELPASPGLLLRSLLLVPQDPAVAGGTGAPVIVVAWTLQYEIIFYAVVALSILHRAVAILIASLCILNYALCVHVCGFPFSFFARNGLLLLFALGAFVAWLSDGRLIIRRPVAVSVVALFGYVFLASHDVLTQEVTYSFARSIAYGAVFSVLILGLIHAEKRGLVLGESRPFQVLGDSSYALYLIHFPLLSALCKVMLAAGLRGYAGAALAFTVMLSVTVCVAVVFHLRLEKPMLRALFSLARRHIAAEGLR